MVCAVSGVMPGKLMRPGLEVDRIRRPFLEVAMVLTNVEYWIIEKIYS